MKTVNGRGKIQPFFRNRKKTKTWRKGGKIKVTWRKEVHKMTKVSHSGTSSHLISISEAREQSIYLLAGWHPGLLLHLLSCLYCQSVETRQISANYEDLLLLLSSLLLLLLLLQHHSSIFSKVTKKIHVQ